MKSPNAKKIISLFGTVMALLMTACGQVRPQTTLDASAPEQNYNQTSCSGGVIYNEAIDGAAFSAKSFQARVEDFVSATLAPTDLGTVSGLKTTKNNYIAISGKAKFDEAGSLIPAQSNLFIQIYDSFVGTLNTEGEKMGAYPVTIDTATSGHLNRSDNSFIITYQDDYGSVSLSGKVQGAALIGRVDFINTTAVDDEGARSGVLGAFTIGTCAFF